MLPEVKGRRFPPPRSVEETDACFTVRDVNGQALAYVYFEEGLRGGARNGRFPTSPAMHLQGVP